MSRNVCASKNVCSFGRMRIIKQLEMNRNLFILRISNEKKWSWAYHEHGPPGFITDFLDMWGWYPRPGIKFHLHHCS